MNRISTEEPAAKPLTKKDLDERISRVAEEVFGPRSDEHDWVPVPISMADFVRRVHPFIVYN
jgi:hypothetical protein